MSDVLSLAKPRLRPFKGKKWLIPPLKCPIIDKPASHFSLLLKVLVKMSAACSLVEIFRRVINFSLSKVSWSENTFTLCVRFRCLTVDSFAFFTMAIAGSLSSSTSISNPPNSLSFSCSSGIPSRRTTRSRATISASAVA
jgi:hypothetical protein